jgi:hypothetical protein
MSLPQLEIRIGAGVDLRRGFWAMTPRQLVSLLRPILREDAVGQRVGGIGDAQKLPAVDACCGRLVE